jgi:hypothetical protein
LPYLHDVCDMRAVTVEAPLADEDGPGEEDGPWAEGWGNRSGLGDPVKHCRCAFTDPDGTVVPGEACPIHTGDAR